MNASGDRHLRYRLSLPQPERRQPNSPGSNENATASSGDLIGPHDGIRGGLTRPEQMAVHRQSREEIERFLISLASFAKHVRSNYRYRPLLQDPNDEMVLEAAISGGAQAIATHNVRHFLPAATLFGIEILTPGRILELGKLP
jgi:hypothetical protein